MIIAKSQIQVLSEILKKCRKETAVLKAYSGTRWKTRKVYERRPASVENFLSWFPYLSAGALTIQWLLNRSALTLPPSSGSRAF